MKLLLKILGVLLVLHVVALLIIWVVLPQPAPQSEPVIQTSSITMD